MNKQLIKFIQLENENETEVRYAFIGFKNKDNTLSGLVFGYEGGGEHSDAILIGNKYIQDELFEEYLEYDDQVTIFNETYGDLSFEKIQQELFGDMLIFSNETGITYINPDIMEDNQKTFINDLGADLGDDFTPPSYANTSWENSDMSVTTDEDLAILAPKFLAEYKAEVLPE
jgi:hypothetical protein